jgi:hypothetical protein
MNNLMSNIPIDITSAVSSAALAGIIWLIKTTNSIDKKQALSAQAIAANEKGILELRGRVSQIEAEVEKIKIESAGIIALLTKRRK